MMTGIVLAGGYSSRMEKNKMLLPINGKPLIYYAVKSLLPVCNRLIVVTGFYDEDIRQALKDIPKVEFLHNKNFAEGMFSSVLCGVDGVNSDVLILPGDCPFVKKETISAILNGHRDIRVPVYMGKSGHPLFMRANLVKELSECPFSDNLKAFRNRHQYEQIITDDPNILNDIDTFKDYESFVDKKGEK